MISALLFIMDDTEVCYVWLDLIFFLDVVVILSVRALFFSFFWSIFFFFRFFLQFLGALKVIHTHVG